MKLGRLFLALTSFVLAASPASANWWQARTDHFILTIDDSEESARDFASRLERFDEALRLLYGVADTPDRRAHPIRVYALQDKLFFITCACNGAVGYYNPRTSGSYIVSLHLPKTDPKSKIGGWSSQVLLLHEYSHHFMYSNFPVAYPFWYSEGFAEFNANTSFEPDGALVIGYPANYRADAIKNGSVGIRQLFEPESYGYPNYMDRLYGRGWLLTHYLMLEPRRKGQLARYLDAINHGTRSFTAAQQAFGNLDKLNDELDDYRRGKLAPPLRIPPASNPPKVEITPLSPGVAEMLPHYIRFSGGISKSYRMGPAMRAEKVASSYPDDAVVQDQLSEIELIAGRYDRADTAADRALALQPNMVDALVHKGAVAVQRASDAKSSDPATWTAARAWFLKANRADPNAVMPLFLYYSSFAAAKAKPSQGAITGLMRAAVLTPESTQIRYALAQQKLRDRDGASARALLQPIAFAPHRSRNRNIPREIIALIDSGKIDEATALITTEKDDDGSGD